MAPADQGDLRPLAGEPTAASARPREAAGEAGSPDEAVKRRVRSVTACHGRNALSQLVGHTTGAFYWPRSGGVVGYTIRDGVAVVLGDPVVPDGSLTSAVEEFSDFCSRESLGCVFHQTRSAAPYDALGFRMLPLGSDAVIPARELCDLRDSKSSGLRYAERKAARIGLSFLVAAGPSALAASAPELKLVSDAWLDARRGPELTFSLGSIATLRDPSICVGTAYSRSGRLEAYASWLPAAQSGLWTIDMMRRRPDAPRGTMEALILYCAHAARASDIEYLNLGIAPFHVEGLVRGTPTPIAVRSVYPHLARIHRIHCLNRFKGKFNPRWETRYLAIGRRTGVWRACNSVLRVHFDCRTMRQQLRLMGMWRRVSSA